MPVGTKKLLRFSITECKIFNLILVKKGQGHTLLDSSGLRHVGEGKAPHATNLAAVIYIYMCVYVRTENLIRDCRKLYFHFAKTSAFIDPGISQFADLRTLKSEMLE